MNEFNHLLAVIKEKLIDFQHSNKLTIEINEFQTSLRKDIDWSKIEIPKPNILKERLNLSTYGMSENTEVIPLDWLVIIIGSYLIGHKLNINQITQALNAINYYGFYGLFELFDVKIQKIKNNEDRFNYYKGLVKYLKGQSKFEEANKCFREVLRISQKLAKTSYTFALQSKLDSDYLQRDGLCIEYSQISFSRLSDPPDLKQRWVQICLDTYAKEIRKINPKQSIEIYNNLLNSKKSIHPLSYQRISFRSLELDIIDSINNKKIRKLKKNLENYEELLSGLNQNPKAEYIRKIIFISLLRKVDKNIDYSKNKWLKYKINRLKDDDAEFILNNCIEEAQIYKDKKHMALAYLEKSYWSKGETEETKTLNAINSLQKGLSLFSENKKTIINKIYSNILQELAESHVKLSNWDEALKYYQKLYEYISFLTEALNTDKEHIDSYIQKGKKSPFAKEFVALTTQEIKNIKSSLLLDYAKLINVLNNYMDSISRIQSLRMSFFNEIVLEQKQIIMHDLSNTTNNIERSINNIELFVKNFSKNGNIHNFIPTADLIENLNDAKSEIKNINLIIDESLNINFEKLNQPAEITDLNEIINNYITLIRGTIPKHINVTFTRGKTIIAKFHSTLTVQLIRNLIENSKEVGKRNQIAPIDIKISCTQNHNKTYLIYSDNTREFYNFKEVINSLNTNKKVKSLKDPTNGGNGLKNLKQFLDIYTQKAPWLLEGDDEKKTLTIPLTNSI